MSEAVAPTSGSAGDHSFADASPALVRAALTPEAAGEFDRLTDHVGHRGYRDFEARTRDRVATRRAQGTDAGVGVGVEEVDALVRARLDRAQ